MAFKIIYITHPDEATAKKISAALIEKKLVACANHFPIEAIYWWQGAVQNEKEIVSIVKTTEKNFEKVKKAIEQIHPYEVPCIMGIRAEANDAYEKWIEECVS